jgi:NAD(P)-dependent dehydrogenase (short-subunit alcohol dehydrogenase family)
MTPSDPKPSTNCNAGIGQYAAFAFARHGITKLALADIDTANLEKTREIISRDFPQVDVLLLHMDVRNKATINDGIAKIVDTWGRLDIALNNAGIAGLSGLTHELADEEIERVLDVNLHGVYRCQKAELAVMVNQEDRGPREGRGRIINVASMFGIVSPSSLIPQTAYAAAKHGECP